ncbi:hypothetical protein [Niameybacter massiliensis]|uniref:hypothetical protein n=1 Tax=Niameybacter massiliensis TaxID=1658108 RepID=UPI0012B51409|nr:hypothetical protein [Niameybacter massiliensis]
MKTGFDFILMHSNDVHQRFNAWWLLWKTSLQLGDQKGAAKCKEALLKQLPEQGYNEYILEQMTKQLISGGDPLMNVL